MDAKIDLVADVLEPLVDKHGLLHILVSLELVCAEKSAHIEMNWQDKALAKEWDKASKAIENVSHKVESLSI